jgi:hypothetical protein
LLFKTRHERWIGNVFLAVLLLVISALLSIFAARIVLGIAIYPWLFWPIIATPALIGPCLLFYCQSIIYGVKIRPFTYLIHLLPFLALLLIFIPESISTPAQGLIQLDAASTIQKTFYTSYFKSFLVITYLIYCLVLLASDKMKISLAQRSRYFLQAFLSVFLVISIAGSIFSTLYWLDIYRLPLADNIELGFLSVITYMLA